MPAVVVLLLTLDASSVWRQAQYVALDFHGYEGAARVGEQWGWGRIYDQTLVRAAEKYLVPHEITLRYISPPPVAWLAAGLTALPFWLAYGVWAAMMLMALAFAFGWSSPYRGPARLVAPAVALVPWWVMHALYVGQVVPLVAASVLVAWRLSREQHDLAAGTVLAFVLLKPQTAVVAPIALLAAGRYRAFAGWAAVAAIVVGESLLTLGPRGVSQYMNSLKGLPASSSDVTLAGALGLSLPATAVCAALIVSAALITARRVRSAPGLAIAIGTMASLLASPYLFENDLCLLGAAGWILWHERPTRFWRSTLVAVWIAAATYPAAAAVGVLGLRRWPLIELALFVALVAAAWFGLLDNAPAISLPQPSVKEPGVAPQRS